jgi:uncharacterized protein
MQLRWAGIVRAFAVASVVGLAATVMGACATHGDESRAYRAQFQQGNYDGALALLEKSGLAESKKNRVLYLLDKGTILHQAGRYAESNKVFTEAEAVAEEYWKTSITETAGELFVNADVTSYPGEDFERVHIHIYRALNYLMLNDLESALVEARQVDLELVEINKAYGDKPTAYREDAFARWLTGVLYESDGEFNDAAIAYRRALGIYEKDYGPRYGTPVPRQLVIDAIRAARLTGLVEQAEQLSAAHPAAAALAKPLPKGAGEVVIIHQSGRPPVKVERNIVLPIPDGTPTGTVIRMAFPEYVAVPYAARTTKIGLLPQAAAPSAPPSVEAPPVSVAPKPGAGAGPAIQVYGPEAQAIAETRTELGENLTAIAIQNLDDRKGRVIGMTIARAAVKVATKKVLDATAGRGWGALFNIVQAVTEKADTRSWLTLPGEIGMARVVAPAGTYRVRLELVDGQGFTMGTRYLDNVTIRPGQRHFVTFRSFL